jgi:hypothetical protein
MPESSPNDRICQPESRSTASSQSLPPSIASPTTARASPSQPRRPPQPCRRSPPETSPAPIYAIPYPKLLPRAPIRDPGSPSGSSAGSPSSTTRLRLGRRSWPSPSARVVAEGGRCTTARPPGHQDVTARAHRRRQAGVDGGLLLHRCQIPSAAGHHLVPSFSTVSSDGLAGNKPASAGETPVAFTIPPHPRTNQSRIRLHCCL